MAFMTLMGMLTALGLVLLAWMEYDDRHNTTDTQAAK